MCVEQVTKIRLINVRWAEFGTPRGVPNFHRQIERTKSPSFKNGYPSGYSLVIPHLGRRVQMFRVPSNNPVPQYPSGSPQRVRVFLDTVLRGLSSVFFSIYKTLALYTSQWHSSVNDSVLKSLNLGAYLQKVHYTIRVFVNGTVKGYRLVRPLPRSVVNFSLPCLPGAKTKSMKKKK